MKKASVLLLVLTTLTLLMVAAPAKAGIGILFTVNSTSDAADNGSPNGVCDTGNVVGTDPECTLRAAIQESNSTSSPDAIHFDIPGSGVKVISPGSNYPVVSQPVTIDGYTQPGTSENTLKVGNNAVLRIRIDGSDAGFATALNITANNTTVRGLSITGFSMSAGLTISGADNTAIEGNFVGTGPGGGQALANGPGVFIQRDFADETDQAIDNTIGGTSPEKRNLISGNGRGVVVFSGSGNTVQGNYIGTTRDGRHNLGNLSTGIDVEFEGTEAVIGGPGVARNVIAFNGGGGVEISDTSTGNRILNNSIFSNDGLGIDLAPSGRTPNDGVGDADTGPNNLQNFPVLLSARNGARTTIKGSLRSTQNGTFTIRFFKNPESSKNEGKKIIGKKTINDTDGDGIMSFTFRPEKRVKTGRFVTATAANDSTGDTSEFSPARRVRD